MPVSKPAISPPPAPNPKRKVLVIYSYHDTLPWQAKVRTTLFTHLESIPEEQRPELFEERFEAHRLSTLTSNDSFLKLLEEKYHNVKLDLIVAENDFAYEFLNKYPKAFPNVKRQYISYSQGQNTDNSLLIQLDATSALQTLLKVLPTTKRIITIMGKNDFTDSEKQQIIQNILPLSRKHIKLELWNDFGFKQLYQSVQQLSSDCVILYFPVSADRFGERKIPKAVLMQLHKISPVPIFTVYDSFLGVGAVGGYMMSADKVGKLIAQAVLGLPLPKSRAEIETATKGNYFDDVELKRWHIPDKALPSDSVIINRQISDWYKYRWEIAAACVALVFETFLIMTLLRSLRLRKEATSALAQEKDLLDRRVAERTAELEESRNLAHSASRAKSEFLANMSHEIRTPMNAIIGMTHLALRTELSPRQHNYLNKIETAAHSLLGIINDILDSSKIEAGKLELEQLTFSVDDILRNLTDIIRIKAKQKNLSLLTSVSSQTPRVLIGDPLRLNQILINLASNAVKFTETGSIIIAVNVEEFGLQTVRLKFSVQDSGIGMSTEQIAELFQPFSQADTSITRKYGGTGLGLVISKQLVTLMGGNLWVESLLDQGSTFYFTATLGVSQQAIFVSENPKAGHSVNLVGQRVLLVEDNEINRELAVELLNDLGLIVEIAENGKRGVERVIAEEFDLVLMDIQMPEMDGLTATRLIREHERLADLPIIAMTAHAMSGDHEKSLAAGMNDHLTKPIDPQKLTLTLSHWMTPKSQHLNVLYSESFAQKLKLKPLTTLNENLPDSLPPFDISAALCRVNGNAKLLKKLLIMFKDNYGGAIAQLQNFLANEQKDEAICLVHSLKGVAGNLEVKELYTAALSVEQALRQQNSDNIANLINSLEKTLNLALAAATTLETRERA